MVVAPRICGICSVSQSAAAAAALADAGAITPTPNGAAATNLLKAAENIADHITHFYLFFMPDFARAIYADRPWQAEADRRFAATRGTASAEMMPARGRLLHVLGILAGKWPHTLAIQPGGTTKSVDVGEKMRLGAVLADLRRFLERQVFAAPLEQVAELDSAEALDAWRDGNDGDLAFFLRLADDLGLESLGRTGDRFLSYGAYGGAYAAGLWRNGAVATVDPAKISEDPSHAWMDGGEAHPSEGVTLPNADKADAYTWCKAPRLDGQVVEVGALARQVIDGQPLIGAAVAASGGNVRNRVLARLLEVARTVPLMEAWVKALRPREPFCDEAALPEAGSGAGLVEAARGSLGHWVGIEHGRIANYQVIAPTTWNFSPRDTEGNPGALEAALVGAPVRQGEETPVAVQHVVRSFDPCMVCTVH